MPPRDHQELRELATWMLTPRSLEELCERCQIGESGMYRRLAVLEAEGYVLYRSRDRDTGRFVWQAAGRDGIPVQVPDSVSEKS